MSSCSTVSRDVLAGDERALEHGVGLVGADLHDGADRLTLHLRVGVVEHRRQLRQRLAPAEDAQQVDGHAPHRRVRRVLQLLDRLPAGGAEAEQQLAQAEDHAVVVFHGQRFGQRPRDARADVRGTGG